ncbi:MAG: prepilin-type N-terminal cleavage/methylation domain-containing protein, partial [Deltaproteobacteria bacterium]|nr:prepilin-type N-terminal cleavage/methylation domain-containing protein [Deltaproteobacteria bacterium]
MGTKKGIFISKKGFTVLELAIVLTIIAIMALMVSPNMGEWAARYRIKGGTSDLADTIQLARLKAVSDGVEYRIQLDLDNETFVLQRGPSWSQEGSVITLHRGVEI